MAKPVFLPAIFLLTLNAIPGYSQVSCEAGTGAIPILRLESHTDPVADITLTCTGGTPTAAGAAVPQVNFVITLATAITSKTMIGPYSEALVLVDEPNAMSTSPARPVLNCGNTGAPDAIIPATCSIVSDGVSTHTYDGTSNTFGSATCDGLGHPSPNSYGCGRPNVFQGHLTVSNQIVFTGVPFDPPGPLGRRIFRFTNIRGDASLLGPPPVAVHEFISVSGPISIPIANPDQIVGFVQGDPAFTVPLPGVIHIQEGFSNSWRTRNVAFTVGNGTPGNAVFSAGVWSYDGSSANYPPDTAQNIPGVLYNTEDLFQWQNNTVNGPPALNPPPGYGPTIVPNIGNPLFSVGYGGINTLINLAGVSDSATRVALVFSRVPPHRSIRVPTVVYLQRPSTPGVRSGVMVLTATDAEGAGPFSAISGATADVTARAVYEILYADPFGVEFADIACTLVGMGSGASVRVEVTYAPFGATSIPRFVESTATLRLF